MSGSDKGNGDSPLYEIRLNTMIKKDSSSIKTSYIGKGRTSNLFPTKRSSLYIWIGKALKIIDAHPELFNKILDKVANFPEVVNLLKEHDIDMSEFRSYINRVKDDPELLEEEINEAVLSSPFQDDPVPLGLSTSSVIGCLITAIVLAPIMMMVGMIIATIVVVTCLNIGGCFETLLQNIMESFVQGFTPPGYRWYV